MGTQAKKVPPTISTPCRRRQHLFNRDEANFYFGYNRHKGINVLHLRILVATFLEVSSFARPPRGLWNLLRNGSRTTIPFSCLSRSSSFFSFFFLSLLIHFRKLTVCSSLFFFLLLLCCHSLHGVKITYNIFKVCLIHFFSRDFHFLIACYKYRLKKHSSAEKLPNSVPYRKRRTRAPPPFARIPTLRRCRLERRRRRRQPNMEPIHKHLLLLLPRKCRQNRIPFLLSLSLSPVPTTCPLHIHAERERLCSIFFFFFFLAAAPFISTDPQIGGTGGGWASERPFGVTLGWPHRF